MLIIKRKKDDGFVLITALLVCFLIASIVAAVMLITAADLKSNAKQRHAVEARFAAESFSDSIFAAIADISNINDFFAELNLRYGDLFGDDGLAAWGTWYKVLPDGTIAECDANDYETACFTMKIEKSADGREIILTVVVRTKCNSDMRNCTYRQFEQRFKIRTFVEDVLITDSENTNLAGAIRPGAYLRNDRVFGSIHTNDPGGFRYCSDSAFTLQGNPTFKAPGTGQQRVGDFCDDTHPFSVDFNFRRFLLGQVDQSGNSDINNSTIFRNIVGSSSPYHRGTTSISLAGENVRFGPTEVLPLPANGVIYVNGDVTALSGTYARSLTIYATGNINITGDILPTGPSVFGTAPNKLLGLATPQNIVFNCLSCNDITVVAALNATGQNVGGQENGRIYNMHWAQGPAKGTVTVYGTMISRYRPVFGSYYAQPAGVLQHGWTKDFRYDENLTYNQPPFFFRTTQSNIARSSITEGPCRESFCT